MNEIRLTILANFSYIAVLANLGNFRSLVFVKFGHFCHMWQSWAKFVIFAYFDYVLTLVTFANFGNCSPFWHSGTFCNCSQFVDFCHVGNFDRLGPILEKLSHFGKLWLSADFNRIC